jgi:hypothetical protein
VIDSVFKACVGGGSDPVARASGLQSLLGLWDQW